MSELMRIVRVLAAYMTLGDYGSSRAIASTMQTALPSATVDPNNYHRGQQRFLAPDSDANNDGTSNQEGWDAAAADGVQNSLTPAQVRDTYRTSALAGPVYDEGAKGSASGAVVTSAKPNKVRPLQSFVQSIRDARQQWNRSVLRNLPPLLRNLFTEREARKNPLIRALNAFIDAQRQAATGGNVVTKPQRGTKTTPSQCPNGSCIQKAMATAMPNYPASLGGMTVEQDGTLVLRGTKIGVSETPGAGHNFYTWNAPGTMLDGSRESKPFRIMDNSLNIWAGMAGRYMSVRKSSTSNGVTISVGCGGGAIRAVDENGTPLEDEYGNEMYLGPEGAYLTLTAQSQRPDYEVVGWQVGTGAPWLNLSGSYGGIVRSGMHGYASPVEQLKKSPAEKTKTASLKAVAGNGGSVYGNFSSAWKGEFLGKVKVPVGTSGYIGAVANPGYRFVQWSDGSTETSRYATLGESGASYKAIFEEVAEYTLEIEDNQLVPDPDQEDSGGSAGQGGDPLCMGYVSVESTDESTPNRKRYYGADEVIALEAHVNSGYKFVHWLGDGTDINGVPLEEITSPTVVIRMGDVTPSAKGSRAKQASSGSNSVAVSAAMALDPPKVESMEFQGSDSVVGLNWSYKPNAGDPHPEDTAFDYDWSGDKFEEDGFDVGTPHWKKIKGNGKSKPVALVRKKRPGLKVSLAGQLPKCAAAARLKAILKVYQNTLTYEKVIRGLGPDIEMESSLAGNATLPDVVMKTSASVAWSIRPQLPDGSYDAEISLGTCDFDKNVFMLYGNNQDLGDQQFTDSGPQFEHPVSLVKTVRRIDHLINGVSTTIREDIARQVANNIGGAGCPFGASSGAPLWPILDGSGSLDCYAGKILAAAGLYMLGIPRGMIQTRNGDQGCCAYPSTDTHLYEIPPFPCVTDCTSAEQPPMCNDYINWPDPQSRTPWDAFHPKHRYTYRHCGEPAGSGGGWWMYFDGQSECENFLKICGGDDPNGGPWYYVTVVSPGGPYLGSGSRGTPEDMAGCYRVMKAVDHFQRWAFNAANGVKYFDWSASEPWSLPGEAQQVKGESLGIDGHGDPRLR